MFKIQLRESADAPAHKQWDEHAARFIHQVVESTKQTFGEDYTLHSAIFDWRCYRTGSFAVWDDGFIINLAMASLWRNDGEIYQHREYASFRTHPTIGSFYSKCKFDELRATIIHEIAHTITFFLRVRCGLKSKAHGWNWKIIYAKLRQQFINPQLECQAQLKQLYREQLNSSRVSDREKYQICSRPNCWGNSLS
jgi:predicted SprT family Zn-dependent metalloprotease